MPSSRAWTAMARPNGPAPMIRKSMSMFGSLTFTRYSGWLGPVSLLHAGGSLPSTLRALERDENIAGPTLCLERDRPALVEVRCIVAGRQRVTVQGIVHLPRLAL